MHLFPNILLKLATACLLTTALLTAHAPAAHATVVMDLSLEELVEQSALIFTGEVLAVDVSIEDELVYSTVTFALTTTIKGHHPDGTPTSPSDGTSTWHSDGTSTSHPNGISTSHPNGTSTSHSDGTSTSHPNGTSTSPVTMGHASSAPTPTLQLRFLGGEAQGLTVDVAGQQIPGVGDRGLFFISDPHNHQVNPLTGWSQGWFPLFDAADGTPYLDLRNHQNYALVLGYPDPLARKMQAVGFSRASIEARLPGSFEFPLADFIAAIFQVIDQQGNE